MRVLNATQIREADKYTIENEPIASIDLMERAALKCVDWILDHFHLIHAVGRGNDTVFHVFCGMGNNGGDGLVIARHLLLQGFKVRTYVVQFAEKGSPDFEANLKRLNAQGAEIINVTDGKRRLIARESDLIIDAIFGSGLSRCIDGWIGDVVDQINSLKSKVLSIDIASGLFADEWHEDSKIIEADVTLTFQVPKLNFLLVDSFKYTGDWVLLDIGLDEGFIDSLNSPYEYVVADEVKNLLQKRSPIGHKGNFGHGYLLAGSKGKSGAALLAAKAVLKSGAGLCTLRIVESSLNAVYAFVPEVMIDIEDEDYLSAFNIPDNATSIGVGPGIGLEDQTQRMLKLLIQEAKVPLVLDADALNILAENKTWLSFLPANSILTPHPGEFDRLFGKSSNSNERLKLQIEMSQKLSCYIVLKGPNTSISRPDGKVFFNSTGNAGMATAGSGDVLTGVMTGFVAQGYNPFIAAILAVYLHGLAGDLYVQEKVEETLMAGDLIDYLPEAIRFIREV